MHVALVTVGDELLAGSTTNTNAAWLASAITDRGSSVERILTIPDDRDLIADTVSRWAAAFDAVIVTGGIGGTPDDITVEAVADGLRGSARMLGVLDAAPPQAARDFVAAHPRCTVAEYRAALGAGPEQARGQLLELLDAGMIRRVPGSRGLRFEHLLVPPADLD